MKKMKKMTVLVFLRMLAKDLNGLSRWFAGWANDGNLMFRTLKKEYGNPGSQEWFDYWHKRIIGYEKYSGIIDGLANEIQAGKDHKDIFLEIFDDPGEINASN